MAHFTYKENKQNDILQQGDILKKTDDIKELLNSIHPKFADDDDNYFMVLTQSCDLMQRKGKCKAKYINIASIKSLDTLIEKEISKYQLTELERKGRFCDISYKQLLTNFLERLFNNNEPEYFYLHEDVGNELDENLVAFLRICIPIEAELNYKICLDSKITELKDEFKAKLGWLIGNIYSRIGTEDWDNHKLEDKVTTTLTNHIEWINKDKLKALKKEVTEDNINTISESEIREKSKKIKILSLKEKLNIELKRVMDDSFYDSYEELIKRLKGELGYRLENDIDIFKSVIKNGEITKEYLELYESIIKQEHEKLKKKLSTRINNDSRISDILNK